MVQMSECTDNGLKAAIIVKDTLVMKEKIANIIRETETIKEQNVNSTNEKNNI